ncbi:PEP-CTERM sorting domain-containing protein [Planctomycetota bacterium]|nr:PEP-CTERM sorting domain-containing protein [Planctomycetota bacterium]
MNRFKLAFLFSFAALTLTTATYAAPIPILHPDTVNHPTVAIGVQGILIDGILVDGITYNATFHTSSATTSFTFNEIWDPNGDGNFSDGITGLPPVFFENETGAIAAFNQIAAALGSTYTTTTANPFDGFSIPLKHPTDNSRINFLRDHAFALLPTDIMIQQSISKTQIQPYFFPWTTFTPIPEPTSLALLSLTTLPLLTRRKRKA